MKNRKKIIVLRLLVFVLVISTGTSQGFPRNWYVDANAGPAGDGSYENPFDTIQEGIDAAVNGDTAIVLDGVYTGTGNRDLDFLGKAITLRSANGPAHCIIDCESGPGEEGHRGFYFNILVPQTIIIEYIAETIFTIWNFTKTG